jgi:hypothetical protein
MAASDGTDRPPRSGRDKRESERVPISGALLGEVMVFLPMTVKEISRGGAQIETSFPLQLDSLHDLRLALGERSIIVKGRVAHCRISGVDQEVVRYLSGIEFVEVSERVSSALAGFMEALKAGRITAP